MIDNPDAQGEGEILIQCTHLMQGYFRKPEATAIALKDGYLHTGDLGRINKSGYLAIMGRKKNVIVTSSGKKVSPEQMESLFSSIPMVSELAIVGLFLVISTNLMKSTSELYQTKSLFPIIT